MRPFVAGLRHLPRVHRAPKSWLESLVKAYVGDGLAADFYREVAEWLDAPTKELVLAVLADTGHSAFAEREVRAAVRDAIRRCVTGSPCGAAGCSARR